MSWRQTYRSGSRADRMLSEIEVSQPPLIADTELSLQTELVGAIEEASREVTLLDSTHADDLAALAGMMLRTESVASSKIERLDAPLDDYARALGGSKANATATAMVAATEALEMMIDQVSATGSITASTLSAAHAALMRDDPEESRHAGRLRTVQNWVGGSDHSPLGADYVPPAPDLVPDLIDDLIRFCGRNDIPALAQAALAHAQFESIHPYTDGNGRIGRGLVNAILRRRGLTTGVVIPLASALLARRDAYFEMLSSYRTGDADPIMTGFTQATAIAARESRVTARNLRDIPLNWRERLGRVRRGSATDRLVEHLPQAPVLTAETAADLIGAHPSNTYTAIDRLVEHEILQGLTDRRRNQVFGAPGILAELTDLDRRIARATRLG